MDNWTRLLTSLEAKEFPLLPHPSATKSQYTRPPAPYDKHLAKNLVPKYTEILENLAGRLVAEVKDTIQRMRERSKDEPPHQLVVGPSVPIKMKAETGVCEWYTHRAKIWCRIVAALGLQDGIWDWSMLEYTSDLRPHHALANGAIVVVDEDNLNIWAQLRMKTTSISGHNCSPSPLTMLNEQYGKCSRNEQSTILSCHGSLKASLLPVRMLWRACFVSYN
jgi:hypothetical protein